MDEMDQIFDECRDKCQELGLPWDINKALWELEDDYPRRGDNRQVA